MKTNHIISGLLTFVVLGLSEKVFAVGSWKALKNVNPSNDGIGICLLMTDGTILAEGSNSNWWRLTPDSAGHYVNGQWSARHNSTWGHQQGSTAVLQSGNVFVGGGENGNGSDQVEIYNPSTDLWTVAVNPTSFGGISDGNVILLPNNKVMVYPLDNETWLFNVANNQFTQTTGAPLQGIGESTWVKLPNDNILVIDSDNSYLGGTTSEQYNPATGTWGNAESGVPNIWPNFSATVTTNGSATVSEMGPAFLLPNGNAIFFGGNGVTAVYSNGNWSASATVPNGLAMWDAPGAMMWNGKILLAVSPPGNPPNNLNGVGPTSFYEYDYTANRGAGGFAQAPNAPSGSSQFPYRAGYLTMLDLPDGTILLSGLGSELWVYQPDSGPIAAGKPAIQSVSANSDGSLHVTGTLFNGICQGASYGDDEQMDTDYPIALFNASGTIYYGTTYNWSSTSVMTGSKVVSTEVQVPAALLGNPGSYTLQIIANGNPSDPVAYDGPIWVDFERYDNSMQNGEFAYPYSTLAKGVTAVQNGDGNTIIVNGSIQPSKSGETLTISTPMTILSLYGPSTIGN
jgi:hypothetical protein